MKNWKESDLVVRGIILKPKTKSKQKNIQLPKKEPEGIVFIKNHLSLIKIPFETETKVHPKRQFRFDISFQIKSLNIAVEYEGIMSKAICYIRTNQLMMPTNHHRTLTM